MGVWSARLLVHSLQSATYMHYPLVAYMTAADTSDIHITPEAVCLLLLLYCTGTTTTDNSTSLPTADTDLSDSQSA